MKTLANPFYPTKIKLFSANMQIALVLSLFVIRVIQSYFEFRLTGTLWGYPLHPFFTLAPIYEEVLFRGFLHNLLSKTNKPKAAFILNCLIFGVWHLKNIFYLEPARLAYQAFYAVIIIGPILLITRIKTKSIWPSIIIHYLNNIWAPISRQILSFP